MKFELDTSPFADAQNSTKKLAEALDVSIELTDKAINVLYSSWVGKGRNAFEKKYKVFEHQISDIRRGIWDLYEDLVNAEGEYIKQDLENAKQMDGRSADYK